MKSNRLMSHAGGLAVAIAILALPGFVAIARAADAPVAAPVAAVDSSRADSTRSSATTTVAAADTTPAPKPAPAPAAADSTPPATPAPTPAPTIAPADTSAPQTPPQLTPSPAPSTTPPPAAAPSKKQKREKAPRAPKPAKVAATPATPATPGDPWAKGRNWLTLNGGYARSGEPGAAPGGYGFGANVRHMFTPKYSATAGVGFDMLGRFDVAKEYEYPVTIAVTRHYSWKTAAKPYFELGYGVFQHQYRGTGDDRHKSLSGLFLATGIDVPTGGRSLVGAYVRYENLSNKQGPPNPVFDGERSFAVRYALRVTWSLVF